MQIKSGPSIQQKAASEGSLDLLKVLGQNMDGVTQGAESEKVAGTEDFLSLLETEMTDEELKDLMSAEQLDDSALESLEDVNVESAKQKPSGLEVKSELPQEKTTVKLPTKNTDLAKLLAADSNKNNLNTINPVTTSAVKGEAKLPIDVTTLQMKEAPIDLPQVATASSVASVALPIKNKDDVALKETQTEADDNLVDLKQFMEKQGSTAQKRIGDSVYKSQVQKSMFAENFNKDQVPNLTAGLDRSDALSKSLDQEIAQVDRNLEFASQLSGKQAGSDMGAQLASGGKTILNLGSIDLNKDSEQVIEQIKNYIMQSQASRSPSVELSFKHDSLGAVDLFIRKTEGDQVSVTIGTKTQEAAKFFTKNQGDLLASLSQSGIKVSEFKLDNQNNFDSSARQFAGQNNHGNSHGQANDQRRQDSDRRHELWQLMREREAA